MADQSRQTVLVIDDSPDIHQIVTVRLRAEDVKLIHAFGAIEGLAMLRANHVDLVLLDLDMPGTDGMTLFREIRADHELVAVPVIFLTGTVDVSVKVQAFDLGAIDYVTKPFDAVELRARVRAALRTKHYYDLLARKAQLDAVTGLWNRAYFDTRLANAIADADRHEHPVALIMVDVDHFKNVNDTYGHPFGDMTLRRVGESLAEGLRPSDVLCRYGGEEFGIVLGDTTTEEAQQAAERLRMHLMVLGLECRNEPVPLTASFGVAGSDLLGEDEPLTGERLVKMADDALYEAKHTGRDRVCVWSSSAIAKTPAKATLRHAS